MANSFYNININKYDPNRLSGGLNTGASSTAQENQSNIQENLTNQNNTQSPINNQLMGELSRQKHYSHERLNALDSTLLENEAYQNIEDENFKKEYKINMLEQTLLSIDKEIENAKIINDTQKVDILTMRKRALKLQLKRLNKDYNNSDVTNKLSGNISSILSTKPTVLTNAINQCTTFMSTKVLPKISKKYNSGQTIKKALNKLETLNKNVDEIVTTQAPYGEADERYDKLSEYLNSANVIHYNISKTIGTPTFFDTISSIDKEKFIAEAKKNKSNFGNMTSRPKNSVEIPNT